MSRVGPVGLREQKRELLCLWILDGSGGWSPFLESLAGRLDHLKLKKVELCGASKRVLSVDVQECARSEAVRLHDY